MPQISLEYSANIKHMVDHKRLFTEIHHILHNKGDVKIENCKSRAMCCHDYHIGHGETINAFVHLEIQWLEGRSTDIISLIGKEIKQILRTYYKTSLRESNLQITVHIIDILRRSYFKIPEGTLSDY